MRLSSAMYNMYLINTLHYNCLITFLCIYMLYFCTYVFYWCARDCLCVHSIDFCCNCSRLYIFVSNKCAAIYRKAHVPLLLVTGPVVIHGRIFVCSKFTYVFGNGTSLTIGGVSFSVRSHTCCTIVQLICNSTHTASREGVCTLWTPYACCHFIVMNNRYIIYSDDLCQCRLV
jgi:hypothetical protein